MKIILKKNQWDKTSLRAHWMTKKSETEGYDKAIEATFEEDGLSFCEEDESEINYDNLETLSTVQSIRPELAKKAQEVYDDWNEDDIDTYAGGGICHLIADELSSIMFDHNIENITYSSDFEQHVYCIALVKEGIYAVDIPHSYYEEGGGFSWTKIKDVEFYPEDITLYPITSDINEWSSFTGD